MARPVEPSRLGTGGGMIPWALVCDGCQRSEAVDKEGFTRGVEEILLYGDRLCAACQAERGVRLPGSKRNLNRPRGAPHAHRVAETVYRGLLRAGLAATEKVRVPVWWKASPLSLREPGGVEWDAIEVEVPAPLLVEVWDAVGGVETAERKERDGRCQAKSASGAWCRNLATTDLVDVSPDGARVSRQYCDKHLKGVLAASHPVASPLTPGAGR